mmetsp:Transcript_53408/g.126317  ORF Transcript_53408/g.126317 Transcript_53408/m.126317 type:complete len:291 (+) Transcript_53408:241-1113(+)
MWAAAGPAPPLLLLFLLAFLPRAAARRGQSSAAPCSFPSRPSSRSSRSSPYDLLLRASGSSSGGGRPPRALELLVLRVRGDQLAHQVPARAHLLGREVEERRQRPRVRQPRVRVPQLVEQLVRARLERGDALLGGILEELRDEVHRLRRRLRPEHLGPGVCLDLGELELGIVLVHRLDFLARGRADDLDDLDKLVDVALAGEEGLSEHELAEDAAEAPGVDGGGVVGGPEDELRRAVVARADVCNVALPPHQHLGAAEVAQLDDVRVRIQEQILRLDVAVANPQLVDVGQ